MPEQSDPSTESAQLPVPRALRELASKRYRKELRPTLRTDVSSSSGTHSKREPPPPEATDGVSWMLRAAHWGSYCRSVIRALKPVELKISERWEKLHPQTKSDPDQNWSTIRKAIRDSQNTDQVTTDLKAWEEAYGSLYGDTYYLNSKILLALKKAGRFLDYKDFADFRRYSTDYMCANGAASTAASEKKLLAFIQNHTKPYNEARRTSLLSRPELQLISAARRSSPEFDRAVQSQRLTYWGGSKDSEKAAQTLYPMYKRFEESFVHSLLQPSELMAQELWIVHEAIWSERQPPSSPEASLYEPSAQGERQLPSVAAQASVLQSTTALPSHCPSCAAQLDPENQPEQTVIPATTQTQARLDEHQRRLLAELIVTPESTVPQTVLTAPTMITTPVTQETASNRTVAKSRALVSLWMICQTARSDIANMRSQLEIMKRSASSDADQHWERQSELQRDLEVRQAQARRDIMTTLDKAGYDLPWSSPSEGRCIEVCDQVLKNLGGEWTSSPDFKGDLAAYVASTVVSSGCVQRQ